MLFKIDQSVDFIELNPSVKAIPEFAERTSQQLTFIALVADYQSPLQQLPERQRREKAAQLAGYKFESDGKRLDKNGRNIVEGKVDSVELGIKKYRELAPDYDKEMLQAVDNRIYSIMEALKTDYTIIHKTDPSKALTLEEKSAKLGTRLAELRDTRLKLQETVQSNVKIDTFTSADLPNDSEQSVLQQYMDRKQ